GQTFTKSFHVTVLGDLTINENSKRSFVIGVSDNSLVAASSADETLIQSKSIVITNTSPGERTITITPVLNQAGTTTITLSITDLSGNQRTYTFDVNVL